MAARASTWAMPLAMLLGLSAWAAQAAPPYVIIMDAGSSGTRLRMFNMTEGLKEIKPSKCDAKLLETTPGLSSYAKAPTEAGASLGQLLTTAAKYIPEELQASTPLWLKATAGMRLVDARQLKAIFDDVRSFLSNRSTCPFKFVETEVLGGEEEAIFMYISTNFVLNLLPEGYRPEETVGVMDMGGASMQVAFPPDGDVLDNEFSFYVHGKRQSVYAKSYIQFGVDTALKRAKVAVVQAACKNATAVDFPCYLKGHTEVMSVNGTEVQIVGTSDAKGCQQLTRSLLHLDYECLMPPCAMMGTHMPSPLHVRQFYAVSNFFYQANNLGLVDFGEERILTPDQIQEATDAICAKTKEEADDGTGAPWKWKKMACFGGNYVRQLLAAFGFPGDSKKISFAHKVEGNTADWSSGAALYETQFMPILLPTRDQVCSEAKVTAAQVVKAFDQTERIVVVGDKAPFALGLSSGVGLAVGFATASTALIGAVWLGYAAGRRSQRHVLRDLELEPLTAA